MACHYRELLPAHLKESTTNKMWSLENTSLNRVDLEAIPTFLSIRMLALSALLHTYLAQLLAGGKIFKFASLEAISTGEKLGSSVSSFLHRRHGDKLPSSGPSLY